MWQSQSTLRFLIPDRTVRGFFDYISIMRKTPLPRKWLTLKTIALTIILLLSLSIWQPAQAQRSRRGARTTKVTKIKKNTNIGNNFDEAQAATLLNDYNSTAKSDGKQPDITPVRNYYNGLNNTGKQQMLAQLAEKTTQLLEGNNKNDALALIHLYSALAPSNDEKLPTMLYIQGTIYAENLDSIKVKETIRQMEMCPQSQQKTELLPKLKENLENVRNYEPLYTKLGGEWVAIDMQWTDPYTFKQKRGLSNFGESSISSSLLSSLVGDAILDVLLQVKHDHQADTMTIHINEKCKLSEQLSEKMAKWTIKEQAYASQIVMPYSQDSIYILWCSEMVDKKSLLLSGLLRETLSTTAAAVNSELAQTNKYSWGWGLFGSFGTMLAEIGLNAVIDELFTPQKKLFALEAYLKIENKYLMTGMLTWKFTKIKPDGSVTKHDELCTPIKLVRWFPESKIAFPRNIHPSVNEKAYKKDKSTAHYYVHHNKSWSFKQALNIYTVFEREQFKYLQLYNDSILTSEGYKGTRNVPQEVVPYIGFDYEQITEKIQKKYKLENQNKIYVTNVEFGSPACFAGLKKNDIIMTVDNTEISNCEEMRMLLIEKSVGDWIMMKVLRGKKITPISIKVTWR